MSRWTWFERHPGRGAWTFALACVAIYVLNTRVAGSLGIALAPAWTWILTLLLLILAIAFIGASINGRPDGVIIDSRNRVSLAQFQATLWTVLVLSAVISAAAAKAYANVGAGALALGIPAELLMAMGIASTSLAASPLILNTKARSAGNLTSYDRVGGTIVPPGDVDYGRGTLFVRTRPERASWADMFRGEEVSNAASPDLGKIQQFVVTLGLVALYGTMLWKRFADGGILVAFPALDDEFVWLLGISHASYLAYKAVPHGSAAAPVTGTGPDAVG